MTDMGERDPSKIARLALGMTRQYEQITRSEARVARTQLSSLSDDKLREFAHSGEQITRHAVVETPRGSRAKLEFDPKLRVFTLAKPLLTGLTYPYDWGFIPSTKADDGDPIDVLIIHEAATFPGPALCVL